MTEREEVVLKFSVGNRTVTVKAMDRVGPEDAYDVLLRGVLHRYVTGEDVVAATGREVKDAILKTNLVV